MKGKHEIIRVNFEGVWMFVRDFGEVGDSTECECGKMARLHLWEVPAGLFRKDYFLACPLCSRYVMATEDTAKLLYHRELLTAIRDEGAAEDERETSAQLFDEYRAIKRRRDIYELGRALATRLSWLCERFNPTLSAKQLVRERLKDESLSMRQIAFLELILLVLSFEAQVIAKHVRRGEETTPFNSQWSPWVAPPPWESPQSWAEHKQDLREMCEPWALALGCAVDDL